ncbi:MAG: hypothetical protein KGQ66_15305 [Acidobacteriota bacterium]|nr:hypothetical protein [Acidobacteriota bacterium]
MAAVEDLNPREAVPDAGVDAGPSSREAIEEMALSGDGPAIEWLWRQDPPPSEERRVSAG